ncbi:hypothetical protein AB0E08_31200 [Streptomyces sp. NPDC048281]
MKGHTLGAGFESRNANHQMKKLTMAQFATAVRREPTGTADRSSD